MEIIKNKVLTGADDRPFLVDIYHVPGGQAKPVVIFSHGFKGFKDWGHWHLMAESFAKAGFIFIAFNFSHNGTTPDQPLDFADLEAFGQNNYSKELEDLDVVINWVFSEAIPLPKDELDTGKIALIGHSRGGGLSIVKAVQDKRVKALITWASVSSLAYSWADTEILKAWKEKEVRHILNGRTQQNMPLYYQLIEDYQKNESAYDIKKAIKELSCPYLIFHGSDDPGVPVQSAHLLQKWQPRAQLSIIEGADHVFCGKHPYEAKELPRHSNILVQKSIEFLEDKI